MPTCYTGLLFALATLCQHTAQVNSLPLPCCANTLHRSTLCPCLLVPTCCTGRLLPIPLCPRVAQVVAQECRLFMSAHDIGVRRESNSLIESCSFRLITYVDPLAQWHYLKTHRRPTSKLFPLAISLRSPLPPSHLWLCLEAGQMSVTLISGSTSVFRLDSRRIKPPNTHPILIQSDFPLP